MKKHRLILILLVTFATGLLWYFKFQKKNAPTPATTETFQKSHEAVSAKKSTNLKPNSQATKPHLVSGSSGNRTIVESLNAAVVEYVERTQADSLYDWKQPINFYGKVVGNNEQPIEGASIHFSWTDLSPNGTSEYQTVSDASGLFSMENQHGKRLSVSASKEGYYSTGGARSASFEYANPADGLFTPDANNPVVFHLRKQGAGTELVTSKYGMIPDFPISIPRDGTPLAVDLMNRKLGQKGQMQVFQLKPEYAAWKQATTWTFKMEIPDGGFVEHNDEFPFEAPENGYQSVLEFKFQKGDPDWAESINKNYYIKFGNPPQYGQIQIQTSISSGGARLKYAVNPNGTRNLEPLVATPQQYQEGSKSNQIKPPVYE